MSSDNRSEAALRQAISAELCDHASPALRAFGEAIAAVSDGRLPCWGTLGAFVRDHVAQDEDRIALWRALVAAGDRRPVLVFFDLCRARPTVLEAIVDDVGRLSPALQCAFVSMPETRPLWERALPHLGPAARDLLVRGPEVLDRERALYASHMGALRAHQMGARVT